MLLIRYKVNVIEMYSFNFICVCACVCVCVFKCSKSTWLGLIGSLPKEPSNVSLIYWAENFCDTIILNSFHVSLSPEIGFLGVKSKQTRLSGVGGGYVERELG